jgi:peptidoglycan/LPS O-acetylase OafA/YrhL
LFSALFVEKEWGWWNPSAFAHLGDASFATYLSNLFTLALVAKAVHFTGLFPLLGRAGTQLLLVVAALIVGVLLNVLLERPLHAYVLRNGGRLFNVSRNLIHAGTSMLGLGGKPIAPGNDDTQSPTVGGGAGFPLLKPVPASSNADGGGRSPQ